MVDVIRRLVQAASVSSVSRPNPGPPVLVDELSVCSRLIRIAACSSLMFQSCEQWSGGETARRRSHSTLAQSQHAPAVVRGARLA
jgi:hypothetical protein